MEKTEITKKVASFVVDSKYDDLPASVVEKVKYILLDSIGCALSGHIADRGRIVLEHVSELGGKSQATIIGNGRTSYALAAFANGELINTLDYDPVGPLHPHVTPFALPPCLALAEREKASGKDLITALAIGHEVGGRVASSINSFMVPKETPPYYEWAQRHSFTSSTFGAVAGAAKILRLNEDNLANAFGIAGASTPVPAGLKWQHKYGPSIMLKFHCWTGWIAQLATFATLLAGRGFTGDTTILDGDWGFWKIYGSPFFKVENLLGELGNVWHVDEVWFKPYPSCGLNHACIDGVMKLFRENPINPDEIDEITIMGSPQLLTPNRSQTEIISNEDPQFSPRAAVALAAYYGDDPGPYWLLPSTYNNPRIAEFMKKVKVEIHPDAEAAITEAAKAGKLQGFFGTTVKAIVRGKEFVAEVDVAKGTNNNPLTVDEIIKKYKNNAGYSTVKSNNIDAVIEMVQNLEKVRDITELTKLLVSGDIID